MKMVPSAPFKSPILFGLIWLTRDSRTIDDWPPPDLGTYEVDM